MSLTRKFLAALGIEQDKIDEIIEAHTETVNALKEEKAMDLSVFVTKDEFGALQKELDALKKSLGEGDNV